MSQLKEGHAPRGRQPAKPPDINIEDSGLPVAEELKLLREENVSLHAKVEEMENLVVLASQEAEERQAKCQREYESLLEEKTEVIRTLHQKNNELRAQAVKTAAGLPEDASNSQLVDRQELQRLNVELAEQRRQQKEDEDSMMGQLRQMEMSLAKDRAELARQRVDMERLHNEIKHELDTASRDGGLRERLQALQRRASDAAMPRPSLPQNNHQSGQGSRTAPPPSGANITKSGLFRRIFFNNGQS
jgi:hypothetical protein